MHNSIERRLYRVREVAESWGLSKSKIHQMISDGQIPSVRIGRSVRIPARVVEAYLNQAESQVENPRAA
jgi:excisionase family DNA binding protein